MRQAARAESPHQAAQGGGLASTAVLQEMNNPLPELHAAVAHQRAGAQLGQTIPTKWGTAIVVRVLKNGDVDCPWPPSDDCYRLKLGKRPTTSPK
jgi:hypothetical protein